MNVKEFTKETSVQIVEGVRDAQSHVASKTQIAPVGSRREKVEFDMGVIVEEGKSREKGAGLSVYAVKAGVAGQSSSSTSTVHRIKFSV
jgi:hypothetical protein